MTRQELNALKDYITASIELAVFGERAEHEVVMHGKPTSHKDVQGALLREELTEAERVLNELASD